MREFLNGFGRIWDFHWIRKIDPIEAGEVFGIFLMSLVGLTLLTVIVHILK